MEEEGQKKEEIIVEKKEEIKEEKIEEKKMIKGELPKIFLQDYVLFWVLQQLE